MNAQDLKNSILQLAVQGKLVEQRPEEGTAKELLAQIKAEKEQLIKDKKIKKEKPLPAITGDEIPFEIPASWEWVRLGEIGTLTRGSGIKRTETGEKGFPCIRYGELYTTYKTRFSKTVSFVDKELYDKSQKITKGDVAMTLTGENKTDIARAVTYEGDEDIAMGGDMTCWSHHNMEPLFLVYFINSPYAISCKRRLATGDIIIHISNDKLATIPIPVPPLAEQKRIVAKIEELLPYIEQHDKAYTKLEAFNKKFPADMKRSILQMAMQGKLVEQRPEEGTADELYEQIVIEKAGLIKEGKIKKEKPLAEITEEEIPFKIPASWKWVRLGNLAWYLDAGKSPNCERQSVVGDEWGVITTTSIQEGYFDDKQNKVLPQEYIVPETMKVCVDDILITRAGPMNRTGVVCRVGKVDYNLILSDKTVRINLTREYVCRDFIVAVINSPRIRRTVIDLMSGMDKQQVNISQDKIKSIAIPLPPLAEQKRIVAKLEQMLPYCDRLIK